MLDWRGPIAIGRKPTLVDIDFFSSLNSLRYIIASIQSVIYVSVLAIGITAL